MRNYKELAALVMVLAVLLTMGFVATSGRIAKQTLCADHLRRIYAKNVSYQNDHGRLPPVWVEGRPWRFWSDHLRSYTDSDRIFCCPADPRVALMFQGNDPLFSFERISRTSYGMNARLNTQRPGISVTLSSLRHPNVFIFYGDGTRFLRMPNEIGIPRHSRKAQYLFGDGHVALKGLSELRRKLPDGRWHFNNLNWHPW
jgi:prepilin-type processing-associated H-X9-DG protein